jgi:hypothetical protein
LSATIYQLLHCFDRQFQFKTHFAWAISRCCRKVVTAFGSTASGSVRVPLLHNQTDKVRMASAQSSKTAEQLKNCGKLLQFIMGQKDAGELSSTHYTPACH